MKCVPRFRFQMANLGMAAGWAAISVFLIQILAARNLSPAQNAQFLAFWGLLFIGYAAATGLQAEVTRVTRNAVHTGVSAFSAQVVVGLTVGGAVAMCFAARAVSHSTQESALLAVGIIAAGGNAATGGILAGSGRWGLFAALTAAEPTVRLLLVAVCAAASGGEIHYEIATVAAGFTWLPFSGWMARGRSGGVDPVHHQELGNATRVMVSVTAAIFMAAITVGLPALIRATSTVEEFRTSAGLLLAVSVTRAVPMMPLTAFASVLVAEGASGPGTRRTAFKRGSLLILGLTALFTVLCLVAGGPASAALFGAEYRLSSRAVALLALAAGLLGVQALSASLALSAGSHVRVLISWIVTSAMFLAAQSLDQTLEGRTVVGLLLAPLAGMAVTAPMMLRRSPGRTVCARDAGKGDDRTLGRSSASLQPGRDRPFH